MDGHSSTFFRRLRLVWVAVNVALAVVTVWGYFDLSALTFMLSFPADVISGAIVLLVIDGTAWSGGRPWLDTLLFGILACISGYVQWFVMGRALAGRVLARFPFRGLQYAGRICIVMLFLGLTFLGLTMVRAESDAKRYLDRTLAIREGMTIGEVRAILGEPNVDEAATTSNAKHCRAGTARVVSFWYEHEWLPRRLSMSSFFLLLCLDLQERVIEVGIGHGH